MNTNFSIRRVLLSLLTGWLSFSAASGQTLFWTDLAGKILKSGVDGTQVRPVLRAEVPEDLLTSADGQTLYWSESGNNSIWKYAAGAAGPVKIVQAGEAVYGLATDQNLLYVAQASGIYKMNTDGSQAALVNAFAGANDLVLVNGELYWTDSPNGKIYKQNAAGTGGTAIFSGLSYPQNLLYNAADQRLYWLEYCGASTCSGIRKGKTDGTGKQTVINEFVQGFALDSAGTKLYCTYDIYDEVFSITTSGGSRATVADITSSPTDIVLFGGGLYWFDRSYGDYLYHSALNGSGQKVLASKSVYRPTRFVADTVQKWLYWVNSPSSFSSDYSAAIKRARFDGSDVQNVVPNNQLDAPHGLAIDMNNQKLYWTDTDDGVIRRADTDGSNVEDVVTGLSAPIDLAVDVANNRIFWTDWSTKTVMRSDLTGGQKTALVSDLNIPWGLYYDAAVDSVFFAEYGGRTIQRVSAGGGAPDTLLTIADAFARPNGIWVDRENNRLYWTDQSRSTVNRATLGGTDVTVVLQKADGLDTPSGIQIFPAGSVVKTQSAALPARQLSPNPFGPVLRLQDVHEGDQVMLCDLTGRPVLEQRLHAMDEILLDTSRLPGGIYLFTLRRADGRIFTKKVIKLPK